MGVYRYTRAACRRRLAVCAEVHDPIVVEEDLLDREEASETPPCEEDPAEEYPPVMSPELEEEEEEEYVPETPPDEPEVVDYTSTTPEYTPASLYYTPTSRYCPSATPPGEEYLAYGMCDVSVATEGGDLCSECRMLAKEIEWVMAAPGTKE